MCLASNWFAELSKQLDSDDEIETIGNVGPKPSKDEFVQQMLEENVNFEEIELQKSGYYSIPRTDPYCSMDIPVEEEKFKEREIWVSPERKGFITAFKLMKAKKERLINRRKNLENEKQNLLQKYEELIKQQLVIDKQLGSL